MSHSKIYEPNNHYFRASTCKNETCSQCDWDIAEDFNFDGIQFACDYLSPDSSWIIEFQASAQDCTLDSRRLVETDDIQGRQQFMISDSEELPLLKNNSLPLSPQNKTQLIRPIDNSMVHSMVHSNRTQPVIDETSNQTMFLFLALSILFISWNIYHCLFRTVKQKTLPPPSQLILPWSFNQEKTNETSASTNHIVGVVLARPKCGYFEKDR